MLTIILLYKYGSYQSWQKLLIIRLVSNKYVVRLLTVEVLNENREYLFTYKSTQ